MIKELLYRISKSSPFVSWRTHQWSKLLAAWVGQSGGTSVGEKITPSLVAVVGTDCQVVNNQLVGSLGSSVPACGDCKVGTKIDRNKFDLCPEVPVNCLEKSDLSCQTDTWRSMSKLSASWEFRDPGSCWLDCRRISLPWKPWTVSTQPGTGSLKLGVIIAGRTIEKVIFPRFLRIEFSLKPLVNV